MRVVGQGVPHSQEMGVGTFLGAVPTLLDEDELEAQEEERQGLSRPERVGVR